jgi:diguanylate cyclase (GGDEF)-like protein/PAS domain S-box-containing protein
MSSGAVVRFANVPIWAKIAAAPVSALLALLVMAVAGFIFLQASTKSVHELNEVAFERYRLASELLEATETAHRLLLKTLSVAANEMDQIRLNESVQASFAAGDRIADRLRQLEGQFQHDNLLVRIRPAFEAYRSAAKDVLDVAQSDPASAELLTFAADRGADNLSLLLGQFKSDADLLRTQSAARTLKLVTKGRWWLFIILCVALVFSAMISMMVTRGIVRPILELTQIIRSIAAGKTDISIPGLDRGDEIAVIAGAIEHCRGSVLTAGRLAAELRAQNLLFDAALNNMLQALVMFDASARLVICNHRFQEMYGLSGDAVRPGCHMRELLALRRQNGTFSLDPEEYLDDVLAAIEDGESQSRLVELPDGRTIAIANSPMPGGGWVGTHEDITERRRAEKQIIYMAHHDALTDLPNRVLLRERLAHALRELPRGERLAVLYLDLDRFKTINDTLGHQAGDELLRAVAERLRNAVSNADTVARVGGDEFTIIQTGIERSTDTEMLARRICNAIRDTYDLGGHAVTVDTSVGIAVAPSDGIEPDQLIKNADMALYRAKDDGRGTYRFFEPEMDACAQARRRLEMELREAMLTGALEIQYQPLVQLESGRISGLEALLRWPHPERGFIPPSEFIPIAEETGLIASLGGHVLRQACADASKWPAHVKLAVNLSPLQFRTGNMFVAVKQALEQSGLSPYRLELEITETLLLDKADHVLATLHALRALGVGISMDDFGTGYSSLSYLRSFPFDKIKIDRSFVHDLETNTEGRAIVHAILSLGLSLGITITAEGIETEADLACLKAAGCHQGQGYLFSKALPQAEVLNLLAKQAEQAA